MAAGPAAALTRYSDAASVELFAGHGLTNMTGIFFPIQLLTTVKLRAARPVTLQQVSSAAVK